MSDMRTGTRVGTNSGRTAENRRTGKGQTAVNGGTTANRAKQNGRPSEEYLREAGTNGKKRKKKKKKHPRLSLAIKIIFLVFLLTVLAGMIIFYVKYGNTLLTWQAEAKEMVRESGDNTFRASEASLVYDKNKKAIAKLKGEKDSYYLTFEEIPQSVKDCFIATEDRDFYKHSGFDIKGIVGAGVTLIKNKLKGEDASRGGSTITQQLARAVFPKYLPYTDHSYSRKIREIFVAMELEKKYSKDEILEFYINNIYYSSGYYGIEAASRGYFSKTASEMSLGEAAFVCSIPNWPNMYDPFEHFENTINRKGRILDQLLEGKYITAAEYNDAYYEDIILDPAEEIKNQDYLTTYAISCATKALMRKQGFEFRYEFNSTAEQKAYDEEYSKIYDECNKSLYISGYQIYTSLNKKMQKKLQKAVNQQLAAFKEKNKDGMYELQGAATCINNKTGRVVAIVGGRHQKTLTGYTLNRGYQSYRQPGSSFKPIGVYAPALENGYTPDSIVDDTFFEGGPRNSDGTYLGKMSLRTAVEKSKNVVAWKVFEDITPSVGLSYIRKMNFSKIVSDDYVPAASLGGLTNGVSTVEMASAYAALANDGKFQEATCIVKILDAEGNVVVNSNKQLREKQVYEETAARTMTDILEGVMVRGTAAGKGLSNMASAGKTGTTSDKKDGWFCGYTPYYSTAVWVGYDTPKTLDNLYGSTYPLYIWNTFMEEIHAGKEYMAFADPEDGSGTTGNDIRDTHEDLQTTPDVDETIDPDALEKTPKPTTDSQATEKPTTNPVPTKNVPTEPTTEPVTTPNEGYDDVGDEPIPEDVGNLTE